MSRLLARAALGAAVLLACAVPVGAQDTVPGAWFLNARQTAGPPVHFVVGGTAEAPPETGERLHLGWRWREGTRDVPRYPQAPGFAPLDESGEAPRTWQFPSSRFGFPVIIVGPAQELWFQQGATSAEWARLLDAMEAAYRQRLSAQPGMDGTLGIGRLGACEVLSAPSGAAPEDSAWFEVELPGAARPGNATSPFLAVPGPVATETGKIKSVRVRRFVRWLRGEGGASCGPELHLFPHTVPPAGQAVPENASFYLTVTDVIPARAGFAQLTPDGWRPGERPLVSDTTLRASVQKIRGAGADLCDDDQVKVLCRADQRARQVLYTAMGTGAADSLRKQISAACEAALKPRVAPDSFPCADPRMWRDSLAGLYRTFYTGPWRVATDPEIISQIDGTGRVSWLVGRGDVTATVVLTLPGGGSGELRVGGSKLPSVPLWVWVLGSLAVLVAAAVAVAVVVRGKNASLDDRAVGHIPALKRSVPSAAGALKGLARHPLHLALLGRKAYLHATDGAGPDGLSALHALRNDLAEWSKENGTDTPAAGLEPFAYALAGWYLTKAPGSVPPALHPTLAVLARDAERNGWFDRVRSGPEWLLKRRLGQVFELANDPVGLVAAGARWAKTVSRERDSSALRELAPEDAWHAVYDAEDRIRSERWLAVVFGHSWASSGSDNPISTWPLKSALKDLSREKGDSAAPEPQGAGRSSGTGAQARSYSGEVLCGKWLRDRKNARPSSEIVSLLLAEGSSRAGERSDSIPDPMHAQRNDPLAWLLLGYVLAGEEAPPRRQPKEPVAGPNDQEKPPSPMQPGSEAERTPPVGVVLPPVEDGSGAQSGEVATLREVVGELSRSVASLTDQVGRLQAEQDTVGADLKDLHDRLLKELAESLTSVQGLNAWAAALSERLETSVAGLDDTIRKRAEERVDTMAGQWHERALEEVRAYAETRLKAVFQPLLDQQERLRPVLDNEGALGRAETLVRAADTHAGELNRVLELTTRLPVESLATLLNPRGPFADADARRVSREEADRVYRQVARNLHAQPAADLEALRRAAHAGTQLGHWINTLWRYLAEEAKTEDFVTVLAGPLQPAAQEEWRRAYDELRSFALYDAIYFTRLYTLIQDEERFLSLTLNRAADIQFLTAAGLTTEGTDLRLRLRAFVAPRKQAGPLDRVLLNLQYVVEAFPREGLKLQREDVQSFQGRLRERCEQHELPGTFHEIVRAFADGIGLRYEPVPYYDGRIDAEPYRSVIKQSVGALSLTGRVGYEIRTDPHNVVRLDRPFFFDDDTYYSGYAYVARDHT